MFSVTDSPGRANAVVIGRSAAGGSDTPGTLHRARGDPGHSRAAGPTRRRRTIPPTTTAATITTRMAPVTVPRSATASSTGGPTKYALIPIPHDHAAASTALI